MNSTKHNLIGRLLAIAALVTTGSFAQGERATVTGTATDASGAIVVGAPVTIRSVHKCERQDDHQFRGIFDLTSLPPERYELRVAQTGFRAAVVSDIPLGAV